MEMDVVKPTLKALIMWEEMTGKAFFGAELNEVDLFTLMYCIYATTMKQVSFVAFQTMEKNEKFANTLASKWKHYERFYKQFKVDMEEIEAEEEDEEDKKVISVKDVVQALIFKYGYDIHYVLNEVELWELGYLIKIGEGGYRSRVEESRLWTYLGVLPHLDPKKSKNMTPKKFFELPWEGAMTTQDRKKALKNETKRAKKTIGMKVKL